MQKGKEFYFKKQPRDNLRTEDCKRVQVHPSALLIAETEANSAPWHLSAGVRMDACVLGHPSRPSHWCVCAHRSLSETSLDALPDWFHPIRARLDEGARQQQVKEKVKQSRKKFLFSFSL